MTEDTAPLTPEADYEQMRRDRGWPTPNHMRRAADALDIFTPARYGDVLRWFADLCDATLDARLRDSQPATEHRMGPPRWEPGDPQDGWTNRCLGCGARWTVNGCPNAVRDSQPDRQEGAE